MKINTRNIFFSYFRRIAPRAVFPAAAAFILALFFFADDSASAYVLLENSIMRGAKGDVDPSAYLVNLYNIGVGIAGVLAVVMLVIGGIEYISSAVIDTKAEAKKRIWAAIGGLLLALLSWLLLNTINPKFVTSSLSLQQVTAPGKASGISTGTSGAAASAQAPAGPGVTQEEAAKQLADFNKSSIGTGASVEVSSSGGCTSQNAANCTSLNGVQQSTLNEAKRIAAECNCRILITAGTEIGHEKGALSHEAGTKIDIRAVDESGKDVAISTFIKTNKNFELGSRTEKDGATVTYKDKTTGAVWALERRENTWHWDVLVPTTNVLSGGSGGW